MSFGIVFGLTAALCWGVADFFARGATRSGGIFHTLLSMQCIATVALLAVATPLGLLHLANLHPRLTLIAALLNLVILAGTALLYRAFAIGTLAIVSPIAASYAAVTALLAIVLSHEHPRPTQLIGIVSTLGGVILVSAVSGSAAGQHADPSSPPEGDPTARVRKMPRSRAPGLPEALISTLIFGVAYWALRFVVADLGGVTVAFIGKASDLIALLFLAPVAGLLPRRQPQRAVTVAPAPSSPSIQPARHQRYVFLMTVIPTALLDTAANIAYNLGIAGSLTSIVAVLSSLFGAVTVLLAWIFLRERLSPWQWLGVITIFLGIVLVSM